MIIFVDIDETICTNSEDRDYSNAKPIVDNLKKINRLYDEGNVIIYWTARGTVTGINWQDVTEKQLEQWGAKYHECRLGKPHYDLMICDKTKRIEEV
jgi:hypothetical protein